MQCPSCKAGELAPRALEPGLIGAACQRCEGVLLSLINYRYWQYSFDTSQELTSTTEQGVCAEDSKGAKLCPKCSRLMTKYRIDSETENRIELCGGCDEVWLDSGEWSLLKALDLHGVLPTIATDAWQRDIRKRRERERWEQHFANVIGVDDFTRVKEFKEWLDQQDASAEIKNYLLTNFD